MGQHNLSLYTAIPTEFKATLASHMVAFFGSFKAASEFTFSRARLPTHSQRISPSSIVVLPVSLLLFLSLQLF